MKFTTAISSLLLASASATTVSWDAGYDKKDRAMTDVSCSDGVNGLITKYGWKTQGQIPKFPYVGGSSDIAGWNSKQCGQCYQVDYKGKSIFVLAIDHAGAGLNLSKAAMNALTKNQADALGRVDAVVTKVGVTKCGLMPKREEGLEFNA